MKDVLVKEIMSTNIVSVTQYENVLTVMEILDHKNVHHLPVVEEGNLIGIVSNTDIERCKYGKSLFVNHDLKEQNESLLSATLVGMIMTENVRSISSNHTLYEAYKIFKQNSFRSLPVVENNKLVGIITPIDFLDHYFDMRN